MSAYPKISAGRDGSSWLVLLLLLTVLVPTGGVVWMMRAAMENERLAVRQRLADAYRVQLEAARKTIDERWTDELARLDAAAGDRPAAAAFASCIGSGLADSVLVLAEDGSISYPGDVPAPQEVDAFATSSDWQRAVRLEFVDRNAGQAAEAYAAAARTAADSSLVGRALQAQARCLLNAGERAQAIEVLQNLRSKDDAVDWRGRSLAADADMRLLELLDADSPERPVAASSLRKRVEHYDDPTLPPDQRLFLMRRLTELDPAGPRLATLAAEDLAAEVASAIPSVPSRNTLVPTGVPGVWIIRSPGGRVAALFRESTLMREMGATLAKQPLPSGVTVSVRPPSQADASGDDFLNMPLGAALPGWRLALNVADGQANDARTDGRRAFYAWTAAAVVATTLALAWLMGDALRRQMRVARLKNDLVATVSHELKTPLASIRLLVDSLLEPGADKAGAMSNGQTREYLELIAHENARLSRLIDNFLTFSRMERGKHQFQFEPVDAQEVVSRAAAAVANRFDGVQADLHVECAAPLPIRGDMDALVTAVVNLLDNAWKYSGDKKQARLTARRAERCIEISVEDNGVGLTPRAARRVFERFYQVDQRLSRTQGGCGLGLSIVRYIVEAHGGRVSVASQPGHGSTFTLSLPIDADAPAASPLPFPGAAGAKS